MKHIQIVVLCLSLLAGVCAGCADEEVRAVPDRKYADGSIVLRVGTSSRMQTRTALAGSYNRHHVQQAYAILYQGEGDAATYVCHKNLYWSPKDSADYGEGVVQEKVYEFAVPPTLQSGSKCTLLCVGLDDQSGATYGLTLNDSQTPAFLTAGKTLADAKAILASGHSTATSELFAGWDTLTYQRKDTTAVAVEMTRRVAGAYAYLKDIPVQVSGKTVKSIQWVLGNAPTTEIGLARKERTADNTLPNDFGSGANTASDAKILGELTLTDIAEANTTTNLYDIDTLYTKRLGLTKGTLLLSAYLLPMAAGTEGTLSVQLLDENDAVVKTFPAQWTNVPEAAGTKTNYSIYPNYVYHAGTRSADSDRPASLAGDRIELVVQPWTEVTIDTDFPKVPLEATIDYDKNPSSYIYDCINTTDKITIMPSLLQRDWKLTLVAEDKDGNVDLDSSSDDFNWIYFVKPDGTHVQNISSSDFTNGNSQAVDITIFIYDYLNPHYSKDGNKKYKYDSGYDPSVSSNWDNINKDWRRARIVIQTDESSSSSYISIRQYNAITVIGNYEDNASNARFSCGFSRYDYGVKRTTSGGIDSSDPTNNQGYLSKWGLLKLDFGDIYDSSLDDRTDYDGYYAHENVKSKVTAKRVDGYWGTDTDISTQPVIRYAWTQPWNYNGTTVYWYLPSRDELYQFFKNTVIHQPEIETNIKVDGLYWSSTAKYNSDTDAAKNRLTYCQKLTKERTNGTDGTLWLNDKISEKKGNYIRNREFRNQLGYARLAHHFDGYDYSSLKFE